MAQAMLPTEAQIRSKMEQLMKTIDLETMSTKQFFVALSAQFGGVDLSSKKKYIKATITEIIDAMESDDESEEETPPKKKGGSGGGGLQAVKEISDEMASFLNSQNRMARTAVVKGIWDYIKLHDLQNPNDKREILLDAKMQSLFGTDKFDMFQMNKYVSPHIHPFPPLDLTTKRKADGDGRKKKPKKKKDGVKKQPGTQAPYRLSDELTAVCGKSILPRPQVTQALWAYIRENNLQNPNDKREIICDDALKRVMGGLDKVTMFSMNKYITPHMLEKLEKSAYVHEDLEARVEDDSD